MVTLSDIELPMIFKNRLLFSHGVHNSWNILPTEIIKSMELTNWSDQKNRSLFLSHSERDAQAWVGRIQNPYVMNGELYGDLEIHDADLAMKLGPGRAPIGVSAEIKWPPQHSDPVDFTYTGFAMVPNPEMPDTMVNFSKQEITGTGYNTAKIQTPYRAGQETTAEFSEETKEEVKEKTQEEILAETGGVITSQSARGSANFAEEKEDSNLMSAERGFNEEKMENTEENVKNVEEEKVVETTEVETTEEVKEESAPAEEEVVEEAKANFSKVDAKLDELSDRMTKMEANIAKFSEAAEAKEEEATEVVEEAKAEETTEEAKVEEVKEEIVEEKEEATEAPAEDAKAEFSELANKLDKLADAIAKKDAAPMSTAEFGNKGLDKEIAVIDRLTESLSN